MENSQNSSKLFSSKDLISKIFWIISFTLSICGLIYNSYGVFHKFNSEPDFSIKIKQRSMREIPFPALTICSPVFAKNNLVNYINIERSVDAGVIPNLTSYEQDIFGVNFQVCNPIYYYKSKDHFKYSENKNFIKLLKESSMNVNELLVYCGINSKVQSCDLFFDKILTRMGYCYSYNMQDTNVIFNDVVSDDFKIIESENYERNTDKLRNVTNNRKITQKIIENSLNWTLDNGYIASHPDLSIPTRATKANYFGAYMFLSRNDSLNICPMFGKVFTFFLHLPNEIPTFFHTERYVPFNHHKAIALTATLHSSDDEIRKFSPTTRGCYFQDERKLKFFKSYTKNHCDLECLTNYTLKSCGCVKFSMPRDENMKICGIDMMKCYLNATNRWPEDDGTKIACGCLPTCNNIEYSIKYEKDSVLDFIKGLAGLRNVVEGDVNTIITMKFHEYLVKEYQTFVAYQFQNFIADMGGLLGLFLGCSLISFIEIIYFVVNKSVERYKMRRNKIENCEDSEIAKNTNQINETDTKILHQIHLIQKQNSTRFQLLEEKIQNLEKTLEDKNEILKSLDEIIYGD